MMRINYFSPAHMSSVMGELIYSDISRDPVRNTIHEGNIEIRFSNQEFEQIEEFCYGMFD